MNDRPNPDTSDETPRADARAREPQPWHAADEKPKGGTEGRRAPIGTHSLTGGGAEVGMPAAPQAADGAPERSRQQSPDAAARPDPLAEPRADIGEILGNKP
jgi:hypothetical protein